MLKQKILIVEDDKSIVHFMKRALEDDLYQVLVAENGRDAKAIFLSHLPAVLVLDLRLPDQDGMLLLGEMKMQHPEIPVIVVSARTWEDAKVKALDMGADDYVAKPFGISELKARIRTALRHALLIQSGSSADEGIFRRGDLVLDVPHHRVMLGDERIHITAHEFQILELLFRHQGKVLTYSFMINQIWGSYVSTDNQILRVNMANIRRKLKEDPAAPKYIQTELGVGYRMMDE